MDTNGYKLAVIRTRPSGDFSQPGRRGDCGRFTEIGRLAAHNAIAQGYSVGDASLIGVEAALRDFRSGPEHYTGRFPRERRRRFSGEPNGRD